MVAGCKNPAIYLKERKKVYLLPAVIVVIFALTIANESFGCL